MTYRNGRRPGHFEYMDDPVAKSKPIVRRGSKPADTEAVHPSESWDKFVRVIFSKLPPFLRHPLGIACALIIPILIVVGSNFVADGLEQCGMEGIASGCVAGFLVTGEKPQPLLPSESTLLPIKVVVVQAPLPDAESPRLMNVPPTTVQAQKTQLAPAPVQLLPMRTPSPIVPLPVADSQSPLKEDIVKVDSNLLATADPYGQVVGSVRAGDTVVVDGQDGPDWMHVRTGNGESGYLPDAELYATQ